MPKKISGIHYDISSLSDVYNAIHVVQQEMGVTGTTAQEAAKTISGSANATKSAWQNVLTAIGTGADLTPLINNLVDSLGNLVNNLSPVVKKCCKRAWYISSRPFNYCSSKFDTDYSSFNCRVCSSFNGGSTKCIRRGVSNFTFCY